MNIKLSLAFAAGLALVVSSQAFAQDNNKKEVPPVPTATPPATQPTVPSPATATTQSLGEMTPYLVVAGVIVAIAVASGGGSSKSNPTTGTTGTR